MYAIRQAEAGTPVSYLCRQLVVSDATLYAWKTKLPILGVSDLRRLRQLEEQTSRLKRLLSDRSLDTHMLGGGPAKKSLRLARHRELAGWTQNTFQLRAVA